LPEKKRASACGQVGGLRPGEDAGTIKRINRRGPRGVKVNATNENKWESKQNRN